MGSQYSGGSQSQAQAGDYKQYIQKYGGKQGSQVSGDYQNYIKNYASGNQANLQSSSGDYKQYINGNSGGSYADPVDLSATPNQRSSPIDMYVRHAKDAQSEDQLDDWKTHADERIKDRVKEYVPSEYQHYADKEQLNDVEKTYKQRLSDLEGKAGSSSAPLDLYEIPNQRYAPMDMYVRHAKDAQNEDQLDDWKTHAEDRVKEYVPSEYKHYAANDVEKKYKQRLSDLEGKAGSSSAPLGFLAGSNGANYDSASVAFFATRNTRRVQIHDGLLG